MRSVLKNILWLFVVFALIVGVNCWADPGNLTQNEIFFSRMISVMQQGYNIEHVADFKDRVFQQKAAEQIERPETLIFGSSRIQQIDTEICGTTTWNAGVSGATTQDICGLYQVFLENGKIVADGTANDIFEHPNNERLRRFLININMLEGV